MISNKVSVALWLNMSLLDLSLWCDSKSQHNNYTKRLVLAVPRQKMTRELNWGFRNLGDGTIHVAKIHMFICLVIHVPLPVYHIHIF